MPHREINGVRLRVEESGSGDPLVLVHGSWDDRQTSALIEDELAPRVRAVSYDRRGQRLLICGRGQPIRGRLIGRKSSAGSRR